MRVHASGPCWPRRCLSSIRAALPPPIDRATAGAARALPCPPPSPPPNPHPALTAGGVLGARKVRRQAASGARRQRPPPPAQGAVVQGGAVPACSAVRCGAIKRRCARPRARRVPVGCGRAFLVLVSCPTRPPQPACLPASTCFQPAAAAAPTSTVTSAPTTSSSVASDMGLMHGMCDCKRMPTLPPACLPCACSPPPCAQTEMGAGHFSVTGRFERLKEIALEYAFLLKTRVLP